MPSDRMTMQELQVLQARNQPISKIDHEADSGPESELQAKIRDNCRQRGWPCLSFPQMPALKTWGGYPAGWPDETILLPYPNVLFLEDKEKKGRASDNQKLMRSIFHYLGHTIHEVRSWKRYVQITDGILRKK